MDEVQILRQIQRKLKRLRRDHPETFSDYALEKEIKISREWIRFLEGRRKPKQTKKGDPQAPTVVALHRYVTFFGKDLEWLFLTLPDKFKKHPDAEIHRELQFLLDAGLKEGVQTVFDGMRKMVK